MRKLQQWQQQWGARPYTAEWAARGGWVGLQGSAGGQPEAWKSSNPGRKLQQWQHQWGPRPDTHAWYLKGGYPGLAGAKSAYPHSEPDWASHPVAASQAMLSIGATGAGAVGIAATSP